jgi:membrane associated rhomboid family serine protease
MHVMCACMVTSGMVRALAILIAVNAVIFGLQSILPPGAEARLVYEFGLSREGLQSGAWWQFVTHAFLHGNLWHLLLNMVSLWFAGRLALPALGVKKFLLLYFMGAIGGGLLQIVMGPPGIDLIGASGAVFAVFLAVTTIYANQELLALIFFVIPLHVRAKYLGYGMVVATLGMMIFNIEPWIGHAAHLGGAITGYLFARACGLGPRTFFERILLPR